MAQRPHLQPMRSARPCARKNHASRHAARGAPLGTKRGGRREGGAWRRPGTDARGRGPKDTQAWGDGDAASAQPRVPPRRVASRRVVSCRVVSSPQEPAWVRSPQIRGDKARSLALLAATARGGKGTPDSRTLEPRSAGRRGWREVGRRGGPRGAGSKLGSPFHNSGRATGGGTREPRSPKGRPRSCSGRAPRLPSPPVRPGVGWRWDAPWCTRRCDSRPPAGRDAGARVWSPLSLPACPPARPPCPPARTWDPPRPPPPPRPTPAPGTPRPSPAPLRSPPTRRGAARTPRAQVPLEGDAGEG